MRKLRKNQLMCSMECPFGHSRFLEEQGGKELGLGRRRYFWCVSLHSWSIFVQARRKIRFEES